jgi:hypothetical protein
MDARCSGRANAKYVYPVLMKSPLMRCTVAGTNGAYFNALTALAIGEI